VSTAAALAIINFQWLLRVRLWDQAELTYRHRHRTVSEAMMSGGGEVNVDKVDSLGAVPCTGLQLIALLGLLRLESKSDSTNSISTVDHLFYPYAHLVGISPILVSALASTGDGIASSFSMPYLSRCALLRACISVYDLSALMFQPYLIRHGSLSDELKDALAFVVSSTQQKENRSISYSTNAMTMITPTEVESVASYIVCDLIPTHIQNTAELFDLYTSSGLFFGLIFEIASSLCLESATPTLRLYGLQTMETWLGRIETENLCARVGTDDIVTGRDGQPVSIGSKILRNMLISRLSSISLMLTKAWSHPAKLVSDFPFHQSHSPVR
jgi:hypothetical protein